MCDFCKVRDEEVKKLREELEKQRKLNEAYIREQKEKREP